MFTKKRIIKEISVYRDVWRTIIKQLEWPEILSMRLVCVLFSNLEETSLEGVRNDIYQELLLCYPDRNRRVQRIFEYSIWGFLLGWSNYLDSKPSYLDVGQDRNHVHSHIPLYDKKKILWTMKCMMQKCCRTHKNRVRTQQALGSTNMIRAARMSGWLKISRPKNWDTYFK